MRLVVTVRGAHTGPGPDFTPHRWSICVELSNGPKFRWAAAAWVPRTIYEKPPPWRLRLYDGGIGPLRWNIT